MRKKIVLLLVTMFALVSPSFGQIKLGVKGGINVTDLSFKNVSDNFKATNRVGFSLGPVVDFKVPILGFGLDAAFLLSFKSAKVEADNTEKNMNQAGIDIPINIKYNFGLSSILGFYLAAGPDFFFNLSKSQKFQDVKFKKENSQVGLNLGGGFTILKHLQIGAAYNIPLSKSGKNNANGWSYKAKSWDISAIYFF